MPTTAPPVDDQGLQGPFVPKRGARVYLALECALLFVVIPLSLFAVRHTFGQMLIPSLVVLAIGCGVVLWRDPAFDRAQLGGWARLKTQGTALLRAFVPGALLLGLLFAWAEPERLFGFPQRNPQMWAFIMVFYPVFSVFPQELIFRAFFFHRYRGLFTHPWAMIVASGFTFGLAHLFFANWLAPLLSALGGLLFAYRYAQSRALLVVCVEHGLWGDFIFTIGMGVYFYGGAIP